MGMTTLQPKIQKSKQSFRVSHRELVVDTIAGSTGFTVQSCLKLNPGLATTFPWVSPLATQWEMYQCHKLIAWYVPIAPSNTQGDIILSPNYDASDPRPTTERQAMDNFGASINSCWNAFSCVLDPASMKPMARRYVRNCSVAGDSKTFDIGTLAVCSNNETGTTAVGKLFLEYDFEFFIPQNDPSPSTTPLYTSMFQRAALQGYTTAVAAPLQLDAPLYDPLGLGTPATGVITPPAGAYRYHFNTTVIDSAAEVFSAVISMFKNGAALTPVQTAQTSQNEGAGTQLNLALSGVVTCNGTDTIQVQITLTGAAGTLQVVANTTALVLTLA